jgi:hypothetical protein
MADDTAARCRDHPQLVADAPCGRCGTFFCAGCLTPRGADRLCAACQDLAGRLPWDDRATLGTVRAWWRTSLLLITAPVPTLARAGAEAPWSGSLGFAALSSLAGFATTAVAYTVVGAGALAVGGAWGSPSLRTGLLVSPLMLVGLLCAGTAWQLTAVLVSAGLDHLGLRLLGVRSGSYAVTVRANALSLGPSLVGLVPVCGLYVIFAWSLVLRVLALRALHGTTTGRAALAVLGSGMLLCGGGLGAYTVLVGTWWQG